MAAAIIKIDPARPERAYSRCREVVAAGGVIVYPTDTFYGLGADPRNPSAIRRIFEIKGREPGRPILLLIGDPNEAREWAAEISGQAEELMKRFWPGPLTLVFRAKADVPAGLTAGTGAIGLRVPGSAQTRGLLQFLGHALTGSSANLSGRPSLCSAGDAARSIGGGVDLILDGGEAPGGKPSTVIDVSTDTPRVIREGAVPVKLIAKCKL